MRKGYLQRLSILIFMIALIFQPAYAGGIDKLVIFGDSLSDNGNIYELTKTAHETIPLIPIIPKNPPYFEGRFSNGPIWVDNLSSSLNVPVVNYAYGGSWAEPILDSKLSVPFSLGMQVNYYLVASALDFHKDKHLYVIWSGGNDYLRGRDDPEYATTNTIASIQKQIEWLIYYGAKNFLILNVPDLGIVPEVSSKGIEFAKKVSELSTLHNMKFNNMTRVLRSHYPDVTFVVGDTTTYFNDIIANPAKYRLKNVTEACYGGGYWLNAAKLMDTREVEAAKQLKLDLVNNPSLRTAYLTSKLALAGEKPCSNPDEYLFWDQIHPTRAAHQIIANIMVDLLAQQGIYGE